MTDKELRIILLEDDDSHARLIMGELRSAGFEFVPMVISTQLQLESALKEFHPDLILSDFYLPDFDGLLALSICQDRCPEVPFVFVTGVLGEELAIETLKHGATDYVLKTHLSRLIPAVRRALQGAEDRSSKKKLQEMLTQEIHDVQEEVRKNLASVLHQISELILGYGSAIGGPTPEMEKCLSLLDSARVDIDNLISRLQKLEQTLSVSPDFTNKAK